MSPQRRARNGTTRCACLGLWRAASALGVDIIQTCEVGEFIKEADRMVGVITDRGRIGAERLGITSAGCGFALAKLAGFRLPVTCYALHAIVMLEHRT